MLELFDIVKEYHMGTETVHALNGVSVAFRESEFVAVLGHSGCGKTTLLNIIGGLDHCTSGDLVINGRSTKQYKDRDWDTYRNHTIGFVFQSYNLIPHQSVLQNVMLALSLSGVSKSEQRARAAKALEDVGLGDQLRKKPSELSGGQMQRVAIARALVNNPDIILADEPTGALDSETSVQVMDILKEISKDKLVIMVTHNPELAERYATRIVRMTDGRITGDSMPLTDAELAEARREAESSRALGGKMKKPSMSFLTSFGLSLKNLFTKKGRTALTAFAGSIGIIGIALIFAVSQGMNDYINTVQQDTLSTYPLTIMSETADMTSLLASFGAAMEEREEAPENTVVERQMMSRVFAQIGTNDLKTFKGYLEDHMDDVKGYLNGIQYGYNVTPQIFTRDINGELLQINPSTIMNSALAGSGMSSRTFGNTGIFSEMIDNKELLDSQYDVLAGRWPSRYDELVLVLANKGGMTDYLAYSLGLRDPQELRDMISEIMKGNEVEMKDDAMSWSYSDLLSLRFRLIDASARYKYNSDFKLWEDMSEDEDYMSGLVENGEELKIVGIVCPKAGVAASALSPGICYLPELTRHVIDRAEEAEIVKNQLADTETDVFSGRTFEDLANNEGSGLDFNDMISVDTDMLSSAFGMDVSEDDISSMVQDYMGRISASITADIRPATEMLKNGLAAITSGVLGDYVDENADEMTGVAFIRAADVENIVGAYMEKDSVKEIVSGLTEKYPLPPELYTQAFRETVTRLLGGYISAMAPEQEDPAAPLTKEAVEAVSGMIIQNPMVEEGFEQLGRGMTEAAMQKAILTAVGEMSGELVGSVAGGFHVDPDKIASAFSFNLSEEELNRLMQAFTSRSADPNAESNLRRLGYSKLDEPYAISIYLVDFESKERFIDFIDDYNSKMESRGEDDLVISYTDITGVLMSSVKTVVDSISYVLIAFVAISLVVSSIMIGVITLISVQERTKEIGILRALGASKRNVSSMFNAETAIIGFAAGVLGIVITYLLCIPIDMILHKVTGISKLSTHLPVQVAVILVFISVALTIISGIIPSRSAAKKDPVVALRTE